MPQLLSSLCPNKKAIIEDISAIEAKENIAKFQCKSTPLLRELVNQIEQFEILRQAVVQGNSPTHPDLIGKLSELLTSIKHNSSHTSEVIKKDLALAQSAGGILQPPANLPKVQLVPTLTDTAKTLSALDAALTIITTELAPNYSPETNDPSQVPSLDFPEARLPLTPCETAPPPLPVGELSITNMTD